MDRRDFLTGASLVLALPAAIPKASAAAISHPAVVTTPARELLFTSPFAPRTYGMADVAFRLARRIERAAHGRWKIAFATSPGSGIDAIARGSDLHFASEHGNVGREPAFAYFAGLPGDSGLEPRMLMRWLSDGGGQTEWNSALQGYGVRPLLAAHSGEYGGLWSASPLGTLRGKTIAAPGLAGEVVKAMGGAWADLSEDAVTSALASCEIAAAEIASLEDALALGSAGNASHCLLRGITGRGSAYSLSVRSALWNRMSVEERHMLSTIAAEHFCASLPSQQALNKHSLRRVARVRGTSFETPSGEFAASLNRVSEAVIADMASRSPLSRRLTQSLARFSRVHARLA